MTVASLFNQSVYLCPITAYTVLKAIGPEDTTATNVTLVSGNLVSNTANAIQYYSSYSIWVKAVNA